MSKIKVLLVDDHQLFLEGVTSMFENVDDLLVIKSLTSGIEALNFLKQNKIDVLVTDISMPEMDGIKLSLKVKKAWPNVKTLVLSTHNDPETIRKVIATGADGYLLKNASKSELLSGIREVFVGNKYFSKEVQQSLTESLFSNKVSKKTIVALSKREKEILILIADELTAQQIAEKLFISQHTVNSHKKNLLSKLRVKNTAGLIKYALTNGLI